jgi:hypothetical protein
MIEFVAEIVDLCELGDLIGRVTLGNERLMGTTACLVII